MRAACEFRLGPDRHTQENLSLGKVIAKGHVAKPFVLNLLNRIF
jgi:hypothetical protein